jgi:hypothetical protein
MKLDRMLPDIICMVDKTREEHRSVSVMREDPVNEDKLVERNCIVLTCIVDTFSVDICPIFVRMLDPTKDDTFPERISIVEMVTDENTIIGAVKQFTTQVSSTEDVCKLDVSNDDTCRVDPPREGTNPVLV